MPPVDDMLAQAEALFESGHANEARRQLWEVLSLAQGDKSLEGQALSDLAVIAINGGDRVEATALASRALHLCPGYLPANEVLACCEHADESLPGTPLPSAPATGTKRLAYLVNHRTLMQAEVPIIQDLGYEVFVPKIVPDDDPDFRSAAVTHEYDESLSCSAATVAVLNNHDFYRNDWGPLLKMILNREFAVVVVALSSYLTPLSEAIANFDGLVVARTFGREAPFCYTDLFDEPSQFILLAAIAASGDRFVFGQGYDHLAEIESPLLRKRAQTITVALPRRIFDHADTWSGNGTAAVFICPGIRDVGYYRVRYEEIKRDFGDLPHTIFGRQVAPVDDPSVLGYLTDDGLVDLYANAPVFVYPSNEERHVHYSPIEAMVVGTPVLYRRGALIDVVADGIDNPGACADSEEMRAKTRALLGGDRRLADAIRDAQRPIIHKFSLERARDQWASVLPGAC